MLLYSMNDIELREMIADYMEKGFLENIIDMFKHDSNLYPMIADLIKDERIRVRLGITALVETLSETNNEDLQKAIPKLVENLKDENPTTRGDTAYLLSIIGGKAISHLLPFQHDPDANVREIVREAIEGMRG